MRTGRPKVALIVTEDERHRLDSLAHRSRSGPGGRAPSTNHIGMCWRQGQQGDRATAPCHAGHPLQVAWSVYHPATGRALRWGGSTVLLWTGSLPFVHIPFCPSWLVSCLTSLLVCWEAAQNLRQYPRIRAPESECVLKVSDSW